MLINRYEDKEFYKLINPIVTNDDFNKTKDIEHHGISRYDHLIRVSYYSYRITKLLHLNYKETAKASALHDFFLDETAEDSALKALVNHPEYAYNNASKYFELTDLETDIIKSHMFPVTPTPPKYLESWIVDVVDNIAAIYERGYSVRKEVKAAASFLFILMINFIRFK